MPEPGRRNELSLESPEDSSAEALVDWVVRRFPRQRIVATTGFGMEGCVLIDLLSRLRVPPRVVYLDTHFLFAETYALRDRLEQRYPRVQLANAGTRLTAEQQEAGFGPRLWETEPDLCCRLRKVDPLRVALRRMDVWITGLRRGQSESRSVLRAVDWDWQYQVVKVSPLAAWSREQVWSYVQEHDVPYNALHEQGYPSIGCTHCTRPVAGAVIGSYSREGRWAGTGKTECGLHLTQPGSAQ